MTFDDAPISPTLTGSTKCAAQDAIESECEEAPVAASVIAPHGPETGLSEQSERTSDLRAETKGEASSPSPAGEDRAADARNTLVSLVDQAVFAITTFGTGVLIGRLLLETQFSVYYLAMTMMIVMRNIQAELVTAPFSVYRQKHQGQSRMEYAGSVVVHQLIICCFSVAPVLAMLAAAQLGWISPAMTPTLLVLLGVAPIVLMRSFLRSFSFASYRFWAAVWIDLAVGIAQFCGIALLWAAGSLSVAGAYAIMGGACLIGIAVWRWTNPEPLRFVRSRVLSDWKKNWVFSRWALASQLTGTTSPYAVPWILEAFHGQASTGVYGACFTLVGIGMHFVTAIANYLTPRSATAFVEGGSVSLIKLLRQAATVYAVVIGIVCLAFFFVGDWPVRLVYGANFETSNWTCVLLAGFVLSISLSVVTGVGLWAVHRPEANLFADLTTMATTIGAAFVLIPWAAETGAAGSMLLGAFSGAVTRTLTLRSVLASYPTAAQASPNFN